MFDLFDHEIADACTFSQSYIHTLKVDKTINNSFIAIVHQC